MDAARVETLTDPVAGQLLDPFAFFPGAKSRIAGLAEGGPCPDPTYVFHTLYVGAAHGPTSFTVRFEGLAASRGNLAVRVHGLAVKAGARAQLINSERISLEQLASQAGEITISFESIRGMTYAVVGLLADDTDARASALMVALDRPNMEREDAAEPCDSGPTAFGMAELQATPRLISLAEPTLAHPVSQRCTPGQLDEEIYSQWRRRLRVADGPSPKQWEQIFILQVLERYGFLREGSRGLGFTRANSPLLEVLAGYGATTATFHDRTTFAEGNIQEMPEDLMDFDFVWSVATLDDLGSVNAGFRFIERAMMCLKPGGLAVHASVLDLSPAEQLKTADEATAFRVRDIERLALTLISRGHEVAQLKLHEGAGRGGGRGASSRTPFSPITSCGLIVRRAAS